MASFNKQQPSDEYKVARVSRNKVFDQSFDLDDIHSWLGHEPCFDDIDNAVDMLELLVQDAGIQGNLSDWPATQTYLANGKGL